MSLLTLTAGPALAIAALGFAGRAHLLGTRGRGWPTAPVALRAGLWLAAAACAARALDLLWRDGWIEAGDVAVAVVLAAYAVVALANLARQRAARGLPYGKKGAELFVPGSSRNLAPARARAEPPAWPGPGF